ncbi:unnamed protein product, partial [Ectocarpus fasciculatus]
MLLMESGVRFHTTTFAHDKTETPNVFSRKLRAAVKQKRLEGIRQIGTDRVVDFKFGSGDSVAHVLLELYSSGNIVLTDASYEIVAALRTHEFEDGVNLRVGEVYPISHTTTIADDRASSDLLSRTPTEFLQWATETERQYAEQQGKNAASKKGGKIKKMVVRHLLLSKESSLSSLGPEIIDHCLHLTGIKPSAKVTEVLSITAPDESASTEEQARLKAAREELAGKLIAEFNNGVKLLELFDGPSSPGYILMKPASQKKASNQAEASPVAEEAGKFDYIDFIPYLFQQHKESAHIKEFPTFAAAVDEYFCKIEEQKLCRAAVAAEEAAHKRIEKTISDQEKMLRGLADTQQRLEAQAASIETCSTEVEKVRMVINSALSNRMSWDDISDMVAAETNAGNPIASLIKKLDLENDTAVLKLPNTMYSEPDDEEEVGSGRDPSSAQYIDATIDLTSSAFNNASALYQERATVKRKEEKAAAASDYVIKKVRDQVMKGLEAQKLKRTLATTRRVHGFEKFNWFWTSDGYLVLSGRDNNQSDILVKKHMRPGDVYIHADLHGSVPCIVRNKHNAKSKPSDDSAKDTLQTSSSAMEHLNMEAGLSVVCRSAAWGAKVVTSAWWVEANCVSKAGPVGEELPPGTFAIFGKKNFLPPTSLEMGFGFLFQVDASSAERHAADRASKGTDDDEETMSLISEASDRYGLDMGLAQTLDGTSVGHVAKPMSSHGATPRSACGAAATMLAAMSSASKNVGRTANVKGGAKDASKKLPAEPQEDRPNSIPTASSSAGRKKAATKKKNKKYANQDEEDYELAMMALGRGTGKKSAKAAKNEKKTEKDLNARQEEAGIGLLKKDWQTLLEPLDAEVRELLNSIVAEGLMKVGDLDSFELDTLSSFQPSIGCSVLKDFKTDIVGRDVTNKSGFLAGIMRRYSKIIKNSTLSAEAGQNAAPTESGSTVKTHDLLAGYEDDDAEGGEEFEEDFYSLISNPKPEDVVLYCVPMCGPYSCFKNFKYKMKLTPGTLKKGKIAKQAQDVFVMFKDCSAAEKSAIEGLNRSELTAAVIGEAKISMPGLQAVQRKQKSAGKSVKK